VTPINRIVAQAVVTGLRPAFQLVFDGIGQLLSRLAELKAALRETTIVNGL
jgi:hypothetical protein